MQKSTIFKGNATLRTMKRILVRTGSIFALGASLLAANSRYAMAQELVRSYDLKNVNADFRAYVTTQLDPASDNGTAVAGNYGPSGPGGGIHFGVVDNVGNMYVGKLLTFREDDVRVVSLVTVKPGLFAMTVQARSAGVNSHIIGLLIDAAGNVLDNATVAINADWGHNLFPMGALYFKDNLYVCGFVTNAGDYPSQPAITDSKNAFVVKLDIGHHTSSIHFYNTHMNYGTTPGVPWSGLYNNYDIAMRLRMLNGNLFVLGSGNGTTRVADGNGNPAMINASKAWVSSIDPATLAPITSSYFGVSNEGVAKTPADNLGAYALDIVQDKQNTGSYYCLTNDFFRHTWQVSHLDPSSILSAPASGNNSFVHTGGANFKGTGLFPSSVASGRFSMYGVDKSDLTLAGGGTSAYGSIIADVASGTVGGAVPFVNGFDLAYNSSAGVTYSSWDAYIEGNQVGFNTNLSYEHPMWLNNAMGEWCNPEFGVQADPNHTNDELIMLGHIMNPVTSSLNPRYIRTDGYGAVNTCPSSQQLAPSGLGYWHLDDATPLVIANHGADVTGTEMEDPELADLLPIDQPECASSNIYRHMATASHVAPVPVLSPNPATDHITVSIAGATGDNLLDLRITDMAGREVFAVKNIAVGTSHSFALPAMARGIYQVTTRCNNDAPVTTKLSVE